MIGLHEFSWNKISWRSEQQMLSLCRETTRASGEPEHVAVAKSWERACIGLSISAGCRVVGNGRFRWSRGKSVDSSVREARCAAFRSSTCLRVEVSIWFLEQSCLRRSSSRFVSWWSCFNFLCSTVKSVSWSVLVVSTVELEWILRITLCELLLDATNERSELRWSRWDTENMTKTWPTGDHGGFQTLRNLLCQVREWKIRTSVSHGSVKKDRKTKEFPRLEGTIFKMWWERRHGWNPWILGMLMWAVRVHGG